MYTIRRFISGLITAVFCLTAAASAEGNGPSVEVSFGSKSVSYTSDYSEQSGYDMYVALYENGNLKEVRKNKASDTIVSDKTVNDIHIFCWNNEMQPVSEKQSFYRPDGVYTNSTKKVSDDQGKISLTDGNLITAGNEIQKLESVELSDRLANSETKKVYQYLATIGNTRSVLFGQENNISHKAGSSALSRSDVYDVVGDYTAIMGLDALSLTGDEFSAYVCNKRYGTAYPNTAEGNVEAAAYLANTAIDNGAIITLSAHMPNFSNVRETGKTGKSYAKYNFKGYTPNVLTGNVMNELLPGGKYNAMYTAYLDMIADFVGKVNGPVLFRPFHENTGSWFWWGADFCTPQMYKDVYAYTVKYLRDTNDLHNLIYVYSPGSEYRSTQDYEERYPGDEYVDMVGLDMYNYAPNGTDKWRNSLNKKLDILCSFAASHGKVAALTETGVSNPTAAGDSQTALLKTGNPEPDWYEKIMNVVADKNIAYFMVWANFGEKNGFYTPYVKWVNGDGTLHGHEMLDYFIEFYNDPYSIFASSQKEMLKELKQCD